MSRVGTSLTVIGSVMSCLAAAVPVQEPISRTERTETIRQMLMELHENDEFTGSLLVAQAGNVIYRDAIASTPEAGRKLLTSPSKIGSVAKTFTAMAVMMLAERGTLRYDDLIARHVTELAEVTPGITFRHLDTTGHDRARRHSRTSASTMHRCEPPIPARSIA